MRASNPLRVISESAATLASVATFRDIKDEDEDTNKPVRPTDVGRIFLQSEPPEFLGTLADADELALPTLEAGGSTKHSGIRFLDTLSHKVATDKVAAQGGFSIPERHELLDMMFPPVEIVTNNQKWRFPVSKSPATPRDRLKLFKKFETERSFRNVTDKSYCPIMNNLIEDLFDEIIRQEILERPERGLLLAQIKNNFSRLHLNLAAVLESSQLKTARMEGTLGSYLSHLKETVKSETADNETLRNQIHDMLKQIEIDRIKHHADKKKQHDKNHKDLDYLHRICSQAKAQIANFELPSKGLQEEGKKAAVATHPSRSQAAISKSKSKSQ